MLTEDYVTKFFSINKKQISEELLIFYEKNLKRLRQDYLLSDVSFFCQHVGEIYKKEYLENKHDNVDDNINQKENKKKKFLKKNIMILSCFKVCMEILTDNSIYSVSKKLYYIILFIIKEKDQEDFNNNRLERETFFNENLYNLSRIDEISFEEKGN